MILFLYHYFCLVYLACYKWTQQQQLLWPFFLSLSILIFFSLFLPPTNTDRDICIENCFQILLHHHYHYHFDISFLNNNLYCLFVLFSLFIIHICMHVCMKFFRKKFFINNNIGYKSTTNCYLYESNQSYCWWSTWTKK